MTFTLPPLLPCYRLERICRYDPNYLNPNSHPFGRFETATDQLRKCDAIIQVIFGFVRVVNPVLTDLFSSASPFWSPRSRGYGLSFLLQFPHPRPHALVTILCSNNPPSHHPLPLPLASPPRRSPPLLHTHPLIFNRSGTTTTAWRRPTTARVWTSTRTGCGLSPSRSSSSLASLAAGRGKPTYARPVGVGAMTLSPLCQAC